MMTRDFGVPVAVAWPEESSNGARNHPSTHLESAGRLDHSVRPHEATPARRALKEPRTLRRPVVLATPVLVPLEPNPVALRRRARNSPQEAHRRAAVVAALHAVAHGQVPIRDHFGGAAQRHQPLVYCRHARRDITATRARRPAPPFSKFRGVHFARQKLNSKIRQLSTRFDFESKQARSWTREAGEQPWTASQRQW